MSAVLHPSHCWGQRPVFVHVEGNQYREVKIPCCLCCLVDGYEDEVDAFYPCRRHDPERVQAIRNSD